MKFSYSPLPSLFTKEYIPIILTDQSWISTFFRKKYLYFIVRVDHQHANLVTSFYEIKNF